MRRMAAGVLATHSIAEPGYPLGSLVPFAMTPEARPVVYVSRIAQHTHNFERDPRASLTVVEAAMDGGDGDPQARGRVSVLGDARRLAGEEREAAAARYGAFFPESRGHGGVHDRAERAVTLAQRFHPGRGRDLTLLRRWIATSGPWLLLS